MLTCTSGLSQEWSYATSEWHDSTLIFIVMGLWLLYSLIFPCRRCYGLRRYPFWLGCPVKNEYSRLVSMPLCWVFKATIWAPTSSIGNGLQFELLIRVPLGYTLTHDPLVCRCNFYRSQNNFKACPSLRLTLSQQLAFPILPPDSMLVMLSSCGAFCFVGFALRPLITIAALVSFWQEIFLRFLNSRIWPRNAALRLANGTGNLRGSTASSFGKPFYSFSESEPSIMPWLAILCISLYLPVPLTMIFPLSSLSVGYRSPLTISNFPSTRSFGQKCFTKI